MIFDDTTHSYTNEEGEKYTSITTFLGQYKPKKDWAKIAEKYAEKGVAHVMKGFAKNWQITEKQAYERWGDEFDGTGAFVQKVWGQKSKHALDAGSFYHNYKEILESKNKRVDYNPLSADGVKNSIDLNNLMQNYTYLELICYSHLHKLCGQADKIIITPENKIICRDFKTSKTIDFEQKAFYNVALKKRTKERYISPISHLTTNNWNTYQLQLSCYCYILELHGYEIDSLWIDHVLWKYVKKPKKGDLVIGEEPEFNRFKIYTETVAYEAKYLKREVAALFNDFRNKNTFKVTW